MQEASTESTREVKWYFEEKGERKGPISESEIEQLIINKTISYGNTVWNSSMQNWTAIEESQFSAILRSVEPPPLLGNSLNNSVVWVLAFAPVIGFLLEYFIAGAIWGEIRGTAKVESGALWYITVILNIALSYYDEKQLAKSGHDTKKFKGFVWLVPVYLYQRAHSLKQNKGYFIAWIICFLLILAA